MTQHETDVRQEGQLRQMGFLCDLGKLINENLLVTQMARVILKEVSAFCKVDFAVLFLKEDDHLVEIDSWTTNSSLEQLNRKPHLVGSCLCGIAAQGQPVYSNDITTDHRCTMPECKKIGLTSFAALPMGSDNQVLGILGLASLTPRNFDEESDFFQTLSGQIFIGLQNSLLYEKLQGSHREAAEYVQELKKIRANLKLNQDLLHSINKAQSRFIIEGDSQELFNSLLTDLLEVTKSEYGFIGETLYRQDGSPYLKTHAITNISWNPETRAFYDEHAPQGMEFTNLQTLFGAALTSGKPVIANDPANDPRSGGLPKGHPALNSFLCVPFYHGGTMTGMVGIANRPGGYDELTLDFLAPLFTTCGNIIEAYRQEIRRRQAEISLRTSEEKYRRLVENLSREYFFYTHDQQGIFTYLSPSITDILGYNQDEFLTHYTEYLTDAPANEEALFHTEQSLLGVPQPAYELEILHKDGSVRVLEVLETSVKDEQGRVVAIEGIGRDRTERKKAELQKADQLQLLSLSADIGLALTREESLQEMLQQVCELFVKHLDVALARIWIINKWEDLLELQASAGLSTRINGEHSRKTIDQASKIGRIAVTHKPHCTNSVANDPQIIDQHWVKQEGIAAFAGHPMLIDGRVVGVMGLFSKKPYSETVLNTLTTVAGEIVLGVERKQSEERLRRSNRALRILSKCSEVLVHATCEEELLHKTCQVITETEGYKLAWIGYRVDDRKKTVRPVAQVGFDGCDLTKLRISWGKGKSGYGPAGTAIRTGKPQVIQNIRVEPSTTYWRTEALRQGCASLVSTPLLDQERRALGAITIYGLESDAFDFEEVRLFEEMAANLVFGITSFRTKAMHLQAEHEKANLEDKLRQSQKMEAIGTLAGGIAHDFNNVLNAILGYSFLLKNDLPKESELYEFASEIRKAGKHAAGLIQQILTFSRRSGQEHQPLQLQYIVKEALKLLRNTLPSTIKLHEKIHPKCATVLADSTQIHQVVVNLCTNAYHAMREKGGTLTVELEQAEIDSETARQNPDLDTGSHVILTVRDTGYGMDTIVRERIFEPYFTTKKKGEGTGLGLATVHGIIKDHSGAITVESRLGKGTTFQVYFPVCLEAGGQENGVDEALALPALNGKVMFVDDVEFNVMVGKHTLERLGCSVVGLTDSQEALAVFSTTPEKFDLVITDQTMPDLTGYEMASRMLEIRPDLPIIMITGHSDTVDATKAKQIGIREFLMKPLEADILAEAMKKVLEGRSGTR